MNSSLWNFSLGNFRIPYYVIPQLDLRISSQRILKFRHCEGAKRAKQSLGILDLGILEFLWNSKLALFFKLRGSGSKKLGSKILERFLVLKPLR